jgi:hypothetical protein
VGPRNRGTCFLKLLVPSYNARAIIGQNGAEILRMQQRTGYEVTMSRAGETFPGTDARIMVVSGTDEELGRFLELKVDFLSMRPEHKTHSTMTLKVLIPSSSASALIGHSGHIMQEMTRRTRCSLSLSCRVEQLQERILTAKGLPSNLLSAMREITWKLQGDENTAALAHLLQYDVDVDPGVWYPGRIEPQDPQLPLLHPEDAGALTKHELVEYLHLTAPMGILIENDLVGKSRNVAKSKCAADVHSCVRQTWDARAGQGPGRGPVSFASELPLPPGLVTR